MGTDFTQRIRRALALRHTPEGRALFAAVLTAVAGHDPVGAADRLGSALADPIGSRSPSVEAWLRVIAVTVGADVDVALSHRAGVDAALGALNCAPGHTGPASRSRARDALRAAAGG